MYIGRRAVFRGGGVGRLPYPEVSDEARKLVSPYFEGAESKFALHCCSHMANPLDLGRGAHIAQAPS